MALAEFAAKALVAAETLGVKKKPIQDFPLDDAERFIVAHLPDLSAAEKRKLKAKSGTFTVADVASIVLAVSQSLLDGEPLQRLRLRFIARKTPPARSHRGRANGRRTIDECPFRHSTQSPTLHESAAACDGNPRRAICFQIKNIASGINPVFPNTPEES